MAYRKALLAYLAAINARRPDESLLFDDHVNSVDRVMTEVRLAMLAQAQGDAAESGKYFAEAVAHCPKSWKDSCTVERLRAFIDRLDRKR